MKKLFLLLLFPVISYSQCFDCAKNFGWWVQDAMVDLTKSNDGLILVKASEFENEIIKLDFNCNVQWSYLFENLQVELFKSATDEQGNIYQLIKWNHSSYTGSENGFTLAPGLNLYKLSPTGELLWNRNIGQGVGHYINDIFYYNGEISVSSTYMNPSIIINNEVELGGNSYYEYPHAFIAKYDTNGNFLNAGSIPSTNGTVWTAIEMDAEGNYFIAGSGNSKSYLKKYSPDYELIWSQEVISETEDEGLYIPTRLFYNGQNSKLYIWGSYYGDIIFMGQPVSQSSLTWGVASLLSQHDSSTGSLLNKKKVDNKTMLSLTMTQHGTNQHGTAYMAEAGGQLFVLTSFVGNLDFSNGTIFSSSNASPGLNEDIVLFSVDQNTLATTLITRSESGDSASPYITEDAAGPIITHNGAIYLTSTFESLPMHINGAVINNNSGNNMNDVMLYKYMPGGENSTGEIVAANTCSGGNVSFSLPGTFTSVEWDFGDPSSANNTSTETSPQHQYSAEGTYHVTAVVQCSGNSQTIEKDIVITTAPSIVAVAPLYACESTPESGISSSFDTSMLATQLTGGNENISLSYLKPDGTPLPTPLANPYTNATPNTENIIVRASWSNNPDCYSEQTIQFITTPVPVANALPNLYACEDVEGSGISSTFNTSAIQQALLGSQTGMVVTYYDSEGNELPSPLPNPISNSIQNIETITARVTNPATQCYSQTTFKLIANPLPQPATGVVISGCDDDNDGISNSFNTGSITSLLLDTGNSGISLSYYDASGNFLFNEFPVDFQNTVPFSQVITARATNTVTGCYNEVAVELKTTDAPSVNTLPVLYACDEGDGYGTFDTSRLGTLIVSDPAMANIRYFDTSGVELASPFPDVYSNTLQGGEAITARVEDINNPACYVDVQIHFIIQPLPAVSIQDTYHYCLSAGQTVINGGAGFTSYSWADALGTVFAITPNAIITEPGEYSLTVTALENGLICTNTKLFNVLGHNAPTITDVMISDNSESNAIEIIVDGTEEYLYSIDGVNYQPGNRFEGLQGGNYKVYVKDVAGCGIDEEMISIFTYPKFFTPNNDGINDIWFLTGVAYTKGTTHIFDRYGKALASFKNNTSGWDGKFKGKTMPATDYWFTTIFEDGKIIQGHFSLIR